MSGCQRQLRLEEKTLRKVLLEEALGQSMRVVFDSLHPERESNFDFSYF